MTPQSWLQVALTLLTGFVISIPVGGYLARVMSDRHTVWDWLCDPIDDFIYGTTRSNDLMTFECNLAADDGKHRGRFVVLQAGSVSILPGRNFL